MSRVTNVRPLFNDHCLVYGGYFIIGCKGTNKRAKCKGKVNINQELMAKMNFCCILLRKCRKNFLPSQQFPPGRNGFDKKMEGSMLMTRTIRNWYYRDDRTALGRSASEVVLQSLGINGGGISAFDDRLSPDNNSIIFTNSHPQTPVIRNGQRTAVTNRSLRGILRRPSGDERRHCVLYAHWWTGAGPAAC